MTYNDFWDHIRLEVLPGRPAKLLAMGWMAKEVHVWLLGGRRGGE